MGIYLHKNLDCFIRLLFLLNTWGINQKCFLHFPYASIKFRFFFENKDHNVSDIHTLVDILLGKQTTNHQSILKS